MRVDGYSIVRYEGEASLGRAVSPVVAYMLTPPAPHLVWWLAVHSGSDTAAAPAT